MHTNKPNALPRLAAGLLAVAGALNLAGQAAAD